MSVSLADLKHYAVRFDAMPLMVYRELAAHLACVAGIETEFEWEKGSTFRYQDSQVEALLIHQSLDADSEQIKRILDHYGAWQHSPLDPSSR
ncbi:hypothetical protein L1047_07885 [Synechococcus sp. Nb3U1]|uniref:hypothetical protein n=1 Tax=Synechococcus sp. Nb3U1 TaxID=1914529 RepID=UPI001F3C0850|nr:hypothetical protein [Synechococcus sp. Nb3U1]MCF2971111.1 hypothetical protein [Synechococcus sp. Nb3U1]